jgi:hypothetical protein
VQNPDEPLTPEERRKLFVCDAFCGEAPQHSRRNQNDSDSRIHQTSSIARIVHTPRPGSFSLNQIRTPRASSRSCSSFVHRVEVATGEICIIVDLS